ncbi:lipoprotein [Streptomyces prasinosporus]|uniref:Lipoprotein n=1 Tax=Streptomyces prasinosporus TaxID=68256 RepID=A0ABP6TLE5_9ACTN
MNPRRTTARRTTARRTAARRLPGLMTVTALGVTVLTGCGIRATEVPTDFGPAPSRVRCSLAEPDASKRAAPGLQVQVFLLCGSSLVAVDRTVRVPDGATDSGRRVVVAQGLLDELAASPSAAEEEAGYTTRVRSGTTVGGPRPGDPEDTLRLSTPPGSLASSALGQIVCTLSDSAAAEGDGSVILGGPDEAPPRRYACTDEVRTRPGGAEPPSTEAVRE